MRIRRTVRNMPVNQRGVLRCVMLLAIGILATLLMYTQGGTKLNLAPANPEGNVIHKRRPLDYTPPTEKGQVQRQSENVKQYQAKLAASESSANKVPASPGALPKSPLGNARGPSSVGNNQAVQQGSQQRKQEVVQRDYSRNKAQRSTYDRESLRRPPPVVTGQGAVVTGQGAVVTGQGAVPADSAQLQQRAQPRQQQKQQQQQPQQQPHRQQQPRPQRQQPRPQRQPWPQQKQPQEQQREKSPDLRHAANAISKPVEGTVDQNAKPLVGENWDKPDPQMLPDLVKVNIDDPSLPRREPIMQGEPTDRLIPNLIPSVVHFIWCRKRWFEFKPYLSIQSAIRFIKPDKVIFHYEYDPMQDELYYHQWLADLKHDFPFFITEMMTEYERRICYGTRETQVALIVEMLRFEGGIYIGESTWILDFPATNLDVDIEVSLEPNGIDGYVILRPGIVEYNNQSLEAIASNLVRAGTYKVKYQQCAYVNQIYNGLKNPHCLIVKGGVFDCFYPSDIWELKHTFGAIVRKIFYGTEEILKPKPSFDTLVPNIGHMIWLGGGPMDFVFYLSVLSMLYVVKVDKLYIHGDVPPPGPYWERLMLNPNVRPRLKFITRPQPLMIYQGFIQEYYRALMSDIIRVDIMIKYGGIYADTDAIWVKPLTYEDRGYDAVASYDWVDWSFPYPDSVNFGLSYGKKNAPFWRIFRDSMRRLHNDVHGFTGVMMPYKLLEKYPHMLRIDRHLQVICYRFRCHPTWVRNYHNMTIDHVTTGSLKNWRQDVNALHWTHPNPPELANETALAAGTGLFAELGRMVLRRAGLL